MEIHNIIVDEGQINTKDGSMAADGIEDCRYNEAGYRYESNEQG
jgi:hypothetical protein